MNMPNWAKGVLYRTGLVVTPEARAIGRAQKELHDKVALALRALLDAFGLERRVLPKPLRRYVGTFPHSVNYKWSWSREILDWTRHRHASPSLAQLQADAALSLALLAAVMRAHEPQEKAAQAQAPPRVAVRRIDEAGL